MVNAALVDTIKFASHFLVSSGVSTMVGYAAKQSVPKVAPLIIRSRPMLSSAFHLFQKVAIPAGAAALAGMASEQAVKYAEKQIDENVVIIEKMKEKIDKATALKDDIKKAADEFVAESEESK